MNNMNIRKESQLNPVADEVSALIAVVRPILRGLLIGLKQDVVKEVGGINLVKLKMLPRLYLKGDGDCGICYEYAVHDAIHRNDGLILDRVSDALTKCKVPGSNVESILFGAEKTGAVQLIDEASKILTDDSRLLTGTQSQPPKLKAYLAKAAKAFRKSGSRDMLPTSIKGLWKADLFVGCTDSDRWVGATVKINPLQLEAATGLRLGIVPARQGSSDLVKVDNDRNLVVCPLPYDGSFMEIFYHGWQIVQQFILADAKIPKEVFLPSPAQRHVAQELFIRREFPIFDVIEALTPMSQPFLLQNQTENMHVDELSQNLTSMTNTVIAPIPNSGLLLNAELSVAERSFLDVQKMMPNLIAEIKNDLKRDESIREFFVTSKLRAYDDYGSQEHFLYFYEEHENLQKKIDTLQACGFVLVGKQDNQKMYQFSEDFFEFIRRND